MNAARFERIDLIAIAIGGLVGAAVRWLLTNATTPEDADADWFAYAPNTSLAIDYPGFDFPWRTLVINLTGCLILGAILTFRRQRLGNRRLLLGAATGLCGSLTTFSTFAVEVATRLRYNHDSFAVTVGSHAADFDREGAGVLLLRSDGVHPATQGLLYLAVSVVGAGFAFNMGRQAATRGDT